MRCRKQEAFNAKKIGKLTFNSAALCVLCASAVRNLSCLELGSYIKNGCFIVLRHAFCAAAAIESIAIAIEKRPQASKLQLGLVSVVAGFASGAGCTKSGFKGVQIAGFGCR